jgi:hypothetical protein
MTKTIEASVHLLWNGKHMLPRTLNTFLGVLVSVFSSTFITLAYYSELLKGELGLIDDHEYLRMLGSDGEIRISEIPKILGETEVGMWGESVRFRPGYYFLRIIQTMFFGGSGEVWYASRLVTFVIFLSLMGFVVWHLLQRIGDSSALNRFFVLVCQITITTFAVFSFAALRAWTDIVTRLGPAEIFVGLGVALLTLGLVLVWFRDSYLLGHWLANAGVVLAVTNKENGVFLLIPLVFFIAFRLRRDRYFWKALIPLAITIIVSFWVLLGVGIAMAKAGGSDVYGSQRSVEGFYKTMFDSHHSLPVIFMIVFILLVDYYLSKDRSNELSHTRVARYVNRLKKMPAGLLAISVLGVYLGEMMFYQESMPGGVFEPARYGLITEIAQILLSLTLILLSIELIGRLSGVFWTVIRAIVAILVITSVMIQGAPRIISASEVYPEFSRGVTSTNEYNMTLIMSAASYLESRPDSSVMIFVDEPYDFERVYSLPFFLEYYSKRDVIFFARVQIPEELKSDQLVVSLSKTLEDFGANGGWQISPISMLKDGVPLLCIYFGSEASSPECDSVIGVG